MSLASVLLSVVFRTSGISPTTSNRDKIFFAFTFAYQLIIGGQSIAYWRSRGTTSFHQSILAISVIIIYFGYIGFTLYANVCVNNFTSLVERVVMDETGLDRYVVGVAMAYFASLAAACAPIALSNSGFLIVTSRCLNLHLFGVPALQFCYIVHLLHRRFQCLNDCLRRCASKKTICTYQIAALFKEHLRLRRLVDDVSTYFTYYHVLNVIGRLIFLTANLYTILVSFTDKDLKMNLSDFTSAIYQFMTLSLQCFTVERCLQQANDTVNIAHSCVNPKSSVELIREVSDFSMYMVNNPVKFSVGGVFSIGNALITRGAGLTITYLLIAIQLESL